jgi:hypothetical protein
MLIRRRAYVRSDGTPVRGSTFSINNRGAPGRGKKLFTLRHGGLSQYGYSVRDPQAKRRSALTKLVNRMVSFEHSIAPIFNKNALRRRTAVAVSRRVGALATLTKRTNPEFSKKYRANQHFISHAPKRYTRT